MKLSVVIPTYNEADNIASLIHYLKLNADQIELEIIVSDGGSNDGTGEHAVAAGATFLKSPVLGRAGQMNFGVKHASGDVYYFVHADTRPPASFATDIHDALKNGYDCGSFRFRFDNNRGLLKVNSFFTRFNLLFFRGGDQSIFVTRALWDRVGTFREEMRIMEDYDFLARIWKAGKFRLVPKSTTVSARKYETNSWLRVQLANLKVVRMYRSGASQQDMIDVYRNALNYRRNAF